VAAESIKRCFKIQTSLNVGQGPARSYSIALIGKPLIWLRPFGCCLAASALVRPDPVPARLCTRPALAFNSKFSSFNQVLGLTGPLSEGEKGLIERHPA
jgi:hypothetical protein